MADSVELYYGPYAYSVGGEFTAVTSPSYLANYAPSTQVATATGTGFETFCVQTQVDFTPYNWGNTTPYNFTLSLSSIGTGWNPSDAFALSEGTAYVYSQFAQGILSGYDYTDTATRITDAGELQAAIWALQGGQTYGGFPSGTTGNPFYTDAVDYLGANNLETAATPSTDFGVEIMNFTDGNGNSAQNQLMYVPPTPYPPTAPDGGATLGLLALSVSGLAALSRRLGAARRAL
jgi:hypothetical protein